MTRDEFITGYVERSRAVGARRIEQTPTGYRAGRYEYVALPCRCGEEGCDGWAMIKNHPEEIAEHGRMNAAEDER